MALGRGTPLCLLACGRPLLVRARAPRRLASPLAEVRGGIVRATQSLCAYERRPDRLILMPAARIYADVETPFEPL